MTLQEQFDSQRTYYDTLMTRDVKFRMHALKRVKIWIKDHDDLIEEALKKDLGKCPEEAYMEEIGMALDNLTYTIKHVHKWAKKKRVRTPLHEFYSRSYTVYEPYGLTLVIAPWNYPFLLAVDPLVSSIAAGNCVILKPSEYAPETSKLLFQMVDTCFDKGHAIVVEGDDKVAKELTDLPFDYLFFTGSPVVGKKIYQKAAETLTPVTLELGGKSPCILTDMIPLEIAAKRIVFGKYLNAGQTCVAPDYIFIQEQMKAQFIDYVHKYIKEFYGEHPLESENLCRIINKKHFNRLKKLLKDQDIIIGGEMDEKTLKIAPTVVNDVDYDNPLMQEEIFGPIMPLVSYRAIEEVIEYINTHPKPLALYIFSNDSYHTDIILDKCSFGGGCVNDTLMHTANHYLPFGGVGTSGIGHYHGHASFKTFSHQRSILHKYTFMDMPFRYPPYNGKNMKIIKKLLK